MTLNDVDEWKSERHIPVDPTYNTYYLVIRDDGSANAVTDTTSYDMSPKHAIESAMRRISTYMPDIMIKATVISKFKCGASRCDLRRRIRQWPDINFDVHAVVQDIKFDLYPLLRQPVMTDELSAVLAKYIETLPEPWHDDFIIDPSMLYAASR